MTDEERLGCIDLCKEFHTSTRDLSEKFLSNAQRHNYVTPTSYLELIRTYKDLLDKKTIVRLCLWFFHKISSQTKNTSHSWATKLFVERFQNNLRNTIFWNKIVKLTLAKNLRLENKTIQNFFQSDTSNWVKIELIVCIFWASRMKYFGKILCLQWNFGFSKKLYHRNLSRNVLFLAFFI